MKMKVCEIYGVGDSGVFRQSVRAVPVPGFGQVLVKSVATSVNPVDIKLRQGNLPVESLPAILHTDFSGFVEALGEGVEELRVGDRVYGCCGMWAGGTGALAQYQVVDARLCAIAPRCISLADCASLPLVSITAYQGLIDKVCIQPGESLCVQSATGGVGNIVCQMAKVLGAKVYGITSSEEKVALLKGYGVTAFNGSGVDSNQFSWAENFGRFDVVYNTVGGDSLRDAFRLVKEYGRVVTIAGRSRQDMSLAHEKNLTVYFTFMVSSIKQEHRRHTIQNILKKITDWVNMGHIVPVVDKERFTLQSVSEAHDYLASGKHEGRKVLIHI